MIHPSYARSHRFSSYFRINDVIRGNESHSHGSTSSSRDGDKSEARVSVFKRLEDAPPKDEQPQGDAETKSSSKKKRGKRGKKDREAKEKETPDKEPKGKDSNGKPEAVTVVDADSIFNAVLAKLQRHGEAAAAFQQYPVMAGANAGAPVMGYNFVPPPGFSLVPISQPGVGSAFPPQNQGIPPLPQPRTEPGAQAKSQASSAQPRVPPGGKLVSPPHGARVELRQPNQGQISVDQNHPKKEETKMEVVDITEEMIQIHPSKNDRDI